MFPLNTSGEGLSPQQLGPIWYNQMLCFIFLVSQIILVKYAVMSRIRSRYHTDLYSKVVDVPYVLDIAIIDKKL